jgi:hypothetical protein
LALGIGQTRFNLNQYVISQLTVDGGRLFAWLDDAAADCGQSYGLTPSMLRQNQLFFSMPFSLCSLFEEAFTVRAEERQNITVSTIYQVLLLFAVAFKRCSDAAVGLSSTQADDRKAAITSIKKLKN